MCASATVAHAVTYDLYDVVRWLSGHPPACWCLRRRSESGVIRGAVTRRPGRALRGGFMIPEGAGEGTVLEGSEQLVDRGKVAFME